MIIYTDGTVRMDEWDFRALYELIKAGNMKPTLEQIEEKRKEITSSFLTKRRHRKKIPIINVWKSEGKE